MLSVFFKYIIADCQRDCIHFNADVHIDRSMVRNMLSIALQTSAGQGDNLDRNYMERSALIRYSGIPRSAHDFKATAIRRSALHTMCVVVELTGREKL